MPAAETGFVSGRCAEPAREVAGRARATAAAIAGGA
jgi:hypothetical protein